MITNKEPFSKLDFGTRPTAVKQDVVAVEANPDLFSFSSYATAFCNEARRRNPARAQEINLTVDELDYYLKGCLQIRIDTIHGSSPHWRQAKQLYLPTWFQFTLSQIGIVIDVDRGLKIIPHYHFSYDIERLLSISERLRLFKSDGMTMVRDGFPRSDEGDYETMTMAVIDGLVKSQFKDSHPISSYVAAFLGLKIQEEATYKVLYRTPYDDIDFIRSMLLREEMIY